MREREWTSTIEYVLVVLLTVGVTALFGRTVRVQDSHQRASSFSEKLDAIIPDFEASGRPMAEIAVQMAYRYKLPAAIEHVDREALQKPLHLRLRGQTVRGLLAAIVASVPGYRIDFSQSLVDIYTTAARQDPSNPFNMPILHFDVDGLDTHLADAQLLCDIGRQLHGHSGCGGSVAGGQWGDRKITLHLENKRVYEILNAIVAQNGQALWAPIVQPQYGSQLLTGNFWYVYPLDPTFEGLAMEELQKLLLRHQEAP